MSNFKWANPPGHKPATKHTKIKGKFRPLAERLVSKPGKWARIYVIEPDPKLKTATTQRAAQFANLIRRGKVDGFQHNKQGKFEAVSRKADDGTGVVYARFVPSN